MKKLLLIPLLLGFISAVNAESYWLILSFDRLGGMTSIEMESMETCEAEGLKFKTTKDKDRFPRNSLPTHRGWHCVVGK